MATDRKSSTRERMRYGICLNDECPKCKSKEVQQFPMRKEFVCAECGKELRECPPPKTKSMTPLIIGAVVAAMVLIGATVVMLGGGFPKEEIAQVDSVKSDTENVNVTLIDSVATEIPQEEVEKKEEAVVDKTPAKEEIAQKTTTVASSSTLNLGYAKFVGPSKNGKPHGMGRMTFSHSQVIDSRDPKKRTAEPGDYCIGEWNEGKLVQCKWYGSDNNVKGSIIIGL